MWKCKHCDVEFNDFSVSQKANHSRWCKSNPRRYSYSYNRNSKNALLAMLEAKKNSGYTNQYSKARRLGGEIPIPPFKGKPSPRRGIKHSEETRKKISDAARASGHRRLKKNTIKYLTKEGNEVLLDSTWEFYLASKLDQLGIKWTRPDPLVWIDKIGKHRHYFPDFHLEKLNLYLDPKNPAAYESQKEKIACLESQMTNLVILKSIQEIDDFLIAISTTKE